MMAAEKTGMPVLILMSKDREEALATKTLTRADIRIEICKRPDRLGKHIGDQTGAVLLTEEAFVGAQISQFLKTLRAQPPWSDLPLLVLTSGSEADEAHHRILDLFGPNANVTFLARPLRGLTLVSAVQAALRARRHQFAVRDLIEERETVLASISDAFSALDRKWRYTHANDKVAAFAGLPASKMIGRVIWEIFPDAVGTEFYDRCQHVMRTGEPSHGEFFHAPWDRWLDVRIYPTKEGIVIFRGDITERKKQEELSQEREAKLKESQDRLRLATELRRQHRRHRRRQRRLPMIHVPDRPHVHVRLRPFEFAFCHFSFAWLLNEDTGSPLSRGRRFASIGSLPAQG